VGWRGSLGLLGCGARMLEGWWRRAGGYVVLGRGASGLRVLPLLLGCAMQGWAAGLNRLG
jgi:hypothetical protein